VNLKSAARATLVLMGMIWVPASALGGDDSAAVAIAVYRGQAGCDGCSEAVKSAIESLDARYRVDIVGPNEPLHILNETLAKYDIYIQPGGGQDINGALTNLGADGVKAIRDFVADGGGYLGICMGAYLAGASNIGLITSDFDSEVGRPDFAVRTVEDAAIDVVWQGRGESVFFQDGPYLQSNNADPAFMEIATYGNGDLAAARYSFGKGLVVLSGPHPEAPEAWFHDAGIPLGRMPSRNLLQDLLDQFDNR